MSKRGPRNPKNFWNDERREVLTRLFNENAGQSDLVLAQRLNEKTGSEFQAFAIAAQRSILGLKKAMPARVRTSPKSHVKGKEPWRRKIKESDTIVFRTGFRKKDVVYMPGMGLYEYKGKETIPHGSAASGTYHYFTRKEKPSDRRAVSSERIEAARIRDPLTVAQAREVEAILRSPPKMSGRWLTVKAELGPRLASPDFRVVAECARDMLGRQLAHDAIGSSFINAGKQAIELLAGEYAHALGMDEKQAARLLEEIATSPKKGANMRQSAPAAVNA